MREQVMIVAMRSMQSGALNLAYVGAAQSSAIIVVSTNLKE
jgi:hypothetical protein